MGAGVGGGGGARIHQGRQDKHIRGSNNYRTERAQGRNPSVLTSNAQDLLRTFQNNRRAFNYVKHPNGRIVVDFKRTIGRFFDTKARRFRSTTRVTIHFDGRGNAHIVPAPPKGFIR